MVNDKEVKATIGVNINEADFVSAKIKINQEMEQIKTNMRNAMSAAGLKIDDSYVRNFTREYKRELDKQTSEVKRAQREQEMAFANRVGKENQLMAQQTRLRERLQEQAGGLIGGYRGMRAMRLFDTAKELNKDEGGSGGFFSTMGTIAAAGAPIAALALGIKTIITVFEDLRQAGKDASAALFEIGGGKNLQATLVQGAKNEMDASRMAGVSDLTTSAVQGMMEDVKSKYGIKQDDINTLFSAYTKGSGGRLQGMPADTLAKLALVTGQPEEVGAFAGRMKMDYPKASAGQLNDLLLKTLLVKDKSNIDVFSNPDMLDQLRTEGIGFSQNLDLLGAIRHGGGMRGRKAVTALTKYEKSDPTLSNLAANAVGNQDTTTVPGAIRAQALNEGFADTKKGLQSFIDHIQDSSEAFTHFNSAVEKTTNTQEAQQTLLQNQIQNKTIERLKDAQDQLAEATKKNAGEITDVTNTFSLIGIKLQTLLVNLEGIAASALNWIVNPNTNNNSLNPNAKPPSILEYDKDGNIVEKTFDASGHKVSSNPIGNSVKTGDVTASGEKDITKNEHLKQTATHTATIAEMMKANNTYLQQVNAHLSLISRLPPAPPTHKPN